MTKFLQKENQVCILNKKIKKNEKMHDLTCQKKSKNSFIFCMNHGFNNTFIKVMRTRPKF
jgi:hypothetical protein